MRRLSEDLKRTLNALALQHAADFLPLRNTLSAREPGEMSTIGVEQQPTRRVALLSDGSSRGGVLQFALDACQRQWASLDLVLYGEARKQAEEIRAQLQRRSIAHEIILLGRQSLEALSEYLNARRALIYLVAPANDTLAAQLAKETARHHGSCLHLPMVLVDANSQSRINRINAA